MKDVIVIGAGAAGMTAALYALRNGKSVLVLEEETLGGQIASSPRVENFPSIMEISGLDFSNNLFEQITAHGADFELEKVEKVEKKDDYFVVTTDYNTHEAKAVVLATGVKHKHLNLPNEERLTGHGISYCAICDGAFYGGKEVALVGDGNTALQYALLLSNYCSKVYVYTLFDKFFGDASLVKVLRSRENIEVRPNTAICGYLGEDKLEGIVYKENGETKTHNVEALFVAIGQVPDNKRFENVVDLDKNGYFDCDETCKTKTQGVYVAGDCRKKGVRQLTTAVADGANAAMAACSYIDSL